MLTPRISLLTAAGLLTTYLAHAQTPAPADGPTPTNILSWITWAAAVIVLLMAVITGTSIAAATRPQADAPAEPTASQEPLRLVTQPLAAPAVAAEAPEFTPVAA